MNKTLIGFFMACLTKTYCNQREICYSEVDNAVSNSYAVFYQNTRSIISCGVQCSNDVCCVRFIYNKISKQCIGVHHMETGVNSSQEITTLSNITRQYRKGCESDWVEFKGHSYFFGKHTATWSDAKMECQKMCSYLVEIEDVEEAEWLSTTFLRNDDCPINIYKDCRAWTGGNDLKVEGEYVWDHSNRSMVFTNWHTNEPSLIDPSSASSRDCIGILRNGKWNDRNCLYFSSFICEKSLDL